MTLADLISRILAEAALAIGGVPAPQPVPVPCRRRAARR